MSSSLPLKFAVIFSLSLAGAASLTTTRKPSIIHAYHRKCPQATPPRLKASVSDLLSLLGSPNQASSVNSEVAEDLFSCFKFISPFNRTSNYSRRFLKSKRNEDKSIDKLILWPPAPVLELARLAVDSGGDPGAIHRALDPDMINVPDVEGSNKDKCELTRTPYGRRFIAEELNSYLEFLFETIVMRGPNIGLNVSLSRYDLFHGHLFITESGRLGILFHAKEYPTYDKEVFPYNMGYCQIGTNVPYDSSMNLRNILWLAPLPSNSTKGWLTPGVLVVLDAHPKGIIYQDLIPEYVQVARTLYEDDFGDVVVDVNYLNIGAEAPNFQIFIC